MFDKAGKTLTIFVILIIILLLCSTSIGFYLYHLEERLHKNVETQLDASRADGLRLQAQIKDLQGQLALAQDKNKEADAKINNLLDEEDLNEGLRAALKKENAGLKDQIASLDAARQKMKADLDDVAAKLSQYQDLLKSSEDKSRELESRLAGLAQTNNELQASVDELKAGTGEIPAAAGGLDKTELDKIVVSPQNNGNGHILSVDTDAQFVIFNLGLREGVKPDALLSIYHGNNYLGDIKATRVQDEMSAADLIPPLSPNAIQKDDTVVLKP